jgi:hypothetical protein
MEESDEVKLVCPVCSKEHVYPLAVERSIVLAMLRREAMEAQPHQRTFVRLFTCPTSDKRFQATLRLSEAPLERIDEVTVGKPEGE